MKKPVKQKLFLIILFFSFTLSLLLNPITPAISKLLPSISDRPLNQSKQTLPTAQLFTAARYEKLSQADTFYQQGNIEMARKLQREVKPDFAPKESVTQAVIDTANMKPAVGVYWRLANEGMEENLESKIFEPLKLLTENYPEFIPGYVLYADALVKYEQPEKALEVLEKVTSLYPQLKEPLDKKIVLLGEQKRWLEAAIAARQFAISYPDDPDAPKYLALAQENTDRYEAYMKQELEGMGLANIILSTMVGNSNSDTTVINLLLEGEAKTGEALAQEYKASLTLVEDPKIVNYVNEVGQKLANVMGRDEFNYEFFVVDDPNVNAFALPGGKIFVKLPNYLDLAVVEFTAQQDYQVATLSSYQDPLYLNRDYEQKLNYSSQAKPYVFVAGWPLEKEIFVFNPGILFDNSATSISSPDIVNPDIVEQNFRGYEVTYTNLTAPGMSGGPVLDANGRLIAIHGRADGKEIDTNDQVIRKYLDEAGLPSIRVKVGLSSGIPIQTFLTWAMQNKIQSQLTIENTAPDQIEVSEVNSAWQPSLAVNTKTNPLYWLELGNQLWRLERFQEAIAAFDEAIKIDNQLYIAWFAKGFALGFNQEYEKAFGACARATEIQPSDYEAWRCQAGALQELQRYDAANEALNRALEYNNTNPADWAIKGDIHLALQQYSEASAAYEQAMKLRSNQGLPISAVILNSQGLTLLALDKDEQALEMFTQAIAVNPNYASAWSNKGWALSELGRHDQSLQASDRAIALNPNSANIWYNRGVTLYQLGLDQEALNCFNKALTINPDYQPALEAREQLQKQ